MSTRTSSGEAFVDGRLVAAIELTEERIEQQVPVAIPGSNRIDYKDASYAGQAYVTFVDTYDYDLARRLERVIEFAGADLPRKRAIRNAGERDVAVELRIEGRTIAAVVSPPAFGHTSLPATSFPVSLAG